MYTCPVCGFNQLADPPTEFSICPCCGTEFELDDAFATHGELRSAWLRSGAHWWSTVVERPTNWDPYSQINNLIESSVFQAVLRAAAVRFFGSLTQRELPVPRQPQQQDSQFTFNASVSQRFTGTSPLEYANTAQSFLPPSPHRALTGQNAA